MLLCGDFRQILPVVHGSTRGNIIDSCVKKSFLWEHTVVKHLQTNMRVHRYGNEAAGQFADQLLAIGNGKFPIKTNPDVIQLPQNMGTFVFNTSELISRVHPDLLSNCRNMVWLLEHCILAPLNKTTHAINIALVAQLPGACCSVPVLWSLDPSRVTNGTRCVISKLSANTIETKISHGKYAGHM